MTDRPERGGGKLLWFFRAVAFDLDGTLTVDDSVSTHVLAMIDDTRRERALLLVTGRTLRDLDQMFPALTAHFDGVVAENGAVLSTAHETRPLHAPVDIAVDKALSDRGVSIDRGHVLVAIDACDAGTAADVIADLGLDCQVVHNRSRAMILPAGVTKGTGLRAATEALGLSVHNAIAVGDAENDLSLLHAAEIGAAVANAVPSLTEHADVVLDGPNGQGVVGLLTGPLLRGEQRLCPQRRWISVGTLDDGSPATLPGSQSSVLITGGSGAGKSYLAGLLAERWIDADYSVLVIDPEGDHLGLSERAKVHLIDAAAGLPTPHDLLALLRLRQTSLVLDLSGVNVDIQLAYLKRLPDAIAAARARHGVPHWIIYDEAHQQAWLEQGRQLATGVGSCLVTWRPELLGSDQTWAADVIINITDPPDLSGLRQARATLASAGSVQPFRIGERASNHVRHQHKYATSPLPLDRRFYFHDQDPDDPAAAAATLGEFSHHISHADVSTLGYHLTRQDFSRWVGGTLADETLARKLAAIEREVASRHAVAIEQARQEICRIIQGRYLKASPEAS